MKVLKYTSNDDFEELVVEEKLLFLIPYTTTYRKRNGSIMRYKDSGIYYSVGFFEGIDIRALFEHLSTKK